MGKHQFVVTKDIRRIAFRDDTPRVEHDGPRADFGDEREIVSGNQDRRLQAGEQGDELSSSAGVEPARRFVEDENLGAIRKKARERHALLLAAA